MASRSARSPKGRRKAGLYEDEEGGLAAFLLRHRLAVGGLTAFAVAFSYVAANAIWYQPHAHGGAFFETRPSAASPSPRGEGEAAQVETVIRLERENAQETAAGAPVPQPGVEGGIAVPSPERLEQAAPPARRGDPVVEEVQRVLARLSFYEGDVDGLTGPQTRAAVEDYRRTVGLSVSPDIDGALLAQLGIASREPASHGTDMIQTASAAAAAEDAVVMRIQAGLRAFGNDGIAIDGVVGSQTRAAIREFQSLFGLPETGEPDTAVYRKMREIGLTD